MTSVKAKADEGSILALNAIQIQFQTVQALESTQSAANWQVSDKTNEEEQEREDSVSSLPFITIPLLNLYPNYK